MKIQKRKSMIMPLCAAGLLCTVVLTPELAAQQGGNNTQAGTTRKSRRRAATGDAQMEYSAQTQLNKGVEFLEAKQDERGIKLIASIAQMYPQSKAAKKADLVLGNYYLEKRQYELALKRLIKASTNDDDPELQAESLYKVGICYYSMNQFNQAFMALRQVINKYPGSVYANEASYYIGLCHFSLKRWTQAVEALERVGTSVPPEKSGTADDSEAFAEAGQRLFVKIHDEDLVVLGDDAQKFKVKVRNENGDEEVMEMEPLGKGGATFIGSIPSEPGEAKLNDGILQTRGLDKVTITHMDTNTTSGKSKNIAATITLVSTASVGFTNGDYQDYCHGVLANQDFFMRVRDLDRDMTTGKDVLKVKVSALYKEEPKSLAETGLKLDGEEEVEYKVRSTREYELEELSPRCGIFVGNAKTRLIDPEKGETVEDAEKSRDLPVHKDDVLLIEYQDDVHIEGRNPMTREFRVKVLTGELPDVASESRIVNDLEVRARKNLIEAKLLLQLGNIFKEVGLNEYADKRSDEGLEKVDELLKINAEAGLERSLLEDAFNTKWELLIVQNKIREAIQVCTMLIRMFPDSALVDRALMKIAEVKIGEESKRSFEEGINIYRGIIQLPKSELKPEAQFKIAESMENRITNEAKQMQARNKKYRPNFANVMLEYRKCADSYPDSPFAGKSLEKIADYYLSVGDNPRVLEMMEQVFRDYPDADFLDNMLLKWAVAAFKQNKFEVASEKCEQLLSEYPNSAAAKKAQQVKKAIQKRLDSAE